MHNRKLNYLNVLKAVEENSMNRHLNNIWLLAKKFSKPKEKNLTLRPIELLMVSRHSMCKN